MYFKKFILIKLTLVLILLNACGLFKPKEIESFNIIVNSYECIMYGEEVEIDFYLTYSNGKTKNVTNWDEVNVSVTGGNYENGKITLPHYPTSFIEDQFTVSATYTDEEISLSATQTFPYNYNDYLTLDFSGEIGENGLDGADGGTSLLFRDGKDGDDGAIGSTGKSGDDLSVFIWTDKTSNKLKIKVENTTTSQTYFFTYVLNDKGLNFYARGGQGGNGGKGGNGGDGKDGKTKNEKEKDPGNGGNGGNGGQGGTGGNGGSVTIFIHENAKSIAPRISINNMGGAGGEGGQAGIGGKGGDPLTGQVAGEQGIEGSPGVSGLIGTPGPEPTIVIQEFDIE